MYIHAFDPGETTGYAILEVVSPRVLKTVRTCCLVEHEEFSSLTNEFDYRLPVIVVIEAFRLYAHKAESQIGSYFPAAEKAGVIKFICWMTGVKWIEQMASCKFPFANLKTIKEVIPDFEKPKTEHEIDAIRHGLYWWFNTGIKQ